MMQKKKEKSKTIISNASDRSSLVEIDESFDETAENTSAVGRAQSSASTITINRSIDDSSSSERPSIS